MGRSCVCCLLVFTVSVPLSFSAEGVEKRNSPADEISVVDVSGHVHTGSLTSISNNELVVEGRGRKVFKLSDLMTLHFLERKKSPVGKGTLLLLDNGDQLVIGPVKMTEDHLLAQWAKWPDRPVIRIPLETIRGLVFDVSRSNPSRNRTVQTLLNNRPKNDVLLLTNGNRVPGELIDIDFSELTLEGPVGKTTVPLKGVRAVRFNSELISFPKVTGGTILLTLTDGSRITAKRIELVPQSRLSVEAVCGTTVLLKLSQLVSFRFLGNRVIALSDLKPVEYKFTPYLSTHWPLMRDRNVLGGELRLRGTAYPKGLGMHSKSRVTYALKEQYSRFQAVIGIDDSAGGQGAAVFSVEVDGKRLFTSQPLTGMSPAFSVKPIDVRGKKRLTLIVDYGPRGDILDHADWCDAVLIK